MNLKNSVCLLLNSYLPCDPKVPGQEDPGLLETLACIKSVVEKSVFDSIIWTGDINADFLRNSNHTETVQDVVNELNLLKLWDEHDVDFTCVHEVNEVTSV